MTRARYALLGLIVILIMLSGHVCSAGTLTAFSDANDKWGYRDSSGKVVIAPQYSAAMEFSKQGIAAVVDEDGWLYIDKTGNPIVRPFVFDNGPDYFEDGLSRYVDNGKMGFINTSGKIVIPAAYDFARPFSEKRAAVCNGCRQEPEGEHKITVGGKWGFIDQKGNVLIPLEYDGVSPFADGRTEVNKDGRTFEIDSKGREVKDK